METGQKSDERGQFRRSSILAWVDEIRVDIRSATRRLAKSAGFSLVVIVTLALGIGATTALYSVLQSVILRSLPYRQAGQLFSVCEQNIKLGWSRYAVSAGNYFDWREQTASVAELAATAPGTGRISGPEGPEEIQAAFASANLFPMLGIESSLGRNFMPEEDQRERANVVILSHRLWQSRFKGDPGIIGRSILLSGRPFTVVGVLPSSFKFLVPQTVAGIPANIGDADLWRPLTVWPAMLQWRANRDLWVVGRLKPGVSLQLARNELALSASRIAQTHPDSNAGWSVAVEPLREIIISKWRRLLWALFGSVAVVLAIVCANIGGLAMARGIGRRPEFAIRSALGAGSRRIVQQTLMENLILAVLGGGLGILLANGGVRVLTFLAPAGIPRMADSGLDFNVLGFASLATIVAGLAFGLFPAWRAAQADPASALGGQGRAVGEGAQGAILRGGLVAAQVALALMLLGSAGLMLRTLAALNQIDPGFNADHVAAFDLSPSGPRYPNGEANIRLVHDLLGRLRALPSVEAAAAIYGLPFGKMTDSDIAIQLDGLEAPGPGAPRVASLRQASDGYFELMRIRLAAGRLFDSRDTTNTPRVVIVNEAFVRRYLAADPRGPLGRRISSPDLGAAACEIIGVVRNVKQTGLDEPSLPEVYQPYAQGGMWQFSIVVKSTQPPGAIMAGIKRELAAVDPDLPISRFRALSGDAEALLAPRRFAMGLIGSFAGLSLLLAALGLYSLLAFNLGRRTREIGLRMAIGASRRDVLGLAIKSGFKPVAIGAIVGAVGSVTASRLLGNLLFGVKPGDPAALALALVAVGLTAAAACWLPARRAAGIDSMKALRAE